MSTFFANFPKIHYDINNNSKIQYKENVTNIFFRLGIIREVLNNASSYYTIDIEDGDTPEILADKVYGDIGAGWIIIYSNKILDPQFDWPLDYSAFDKYIKSKYGSIALAQTTTHHCEKVVTRTVNPGNYTTVTKFVIDEQRLTLNDIGVPHDFYIPYRYFKGVTVDSTALKADSTLVKVDSEDEYDYGLAAAGEYYTYEIGDKTVSEVVNKNTVSCYDYELALNDAKRTIKVIKSDYYNEIMKEFYELTGTFVPFLRTVVPAY